MSFIYDDKNLVETLIKAAQQAAAKPGAAPTQTDPEDDYTDTDKVSAALKLVTNIENSATQEPGEPLITSSSDNAENNKLTIQNLENLGALVDFCVLNGIMVDYQQVAFDGNTDPPPQGNYRLYKLEGNAGFVEIEPRTRVTKGFYIDKDLLVKYLQSLLAIANKTENRAMQVPLSYLVQQANKQLGTKIDPSYKGKEKEKSGEKPGEATTGPTQADITLVTDMANNLPLRPDFLDFSRINYFLTKFKQLLSTSKNPNKDSALSEIANVEGAMSKAMQLGGNSPVAFSGSYQSIVHRLAKGGIQVTDTYMPYLQNLSYIVDTVGSLVDQLYAMYEYIFRYPQLSRQLAEVKQQSANSNSYKVQNQRFIQGWIDDQPRAVNVKT